MLWNHKNVNFTILHTALLMASCCVQTCFAQLHEVYGDVKAVFEYEYKLSQKSQLDCWAEPVATYMKMISGNDCAYPFQRHSLSDETLKQFKLKQILLSDDYGRFVESLSMDGDGSINRKSYSYDSLPIHRPMPKRTSNEEVRNGLSAVLPSVNAPSTSNIVTGKNGRIVKVEEPSGDYRLYKYDWRGRIKGVEEYGEGFLDYSAKYTYHMNGQLKKESESGFFPNGGSESHIIYYNKRGLKTEDRRIVQNSSSINEEVLFYEYNSAGQFTRQFYVENGNQITVFRVDYDSKGRETLFKYRDSNQRVKAYDNDGNLMEVLYYNDGTLSGGTLYHYVR